MPGRILIADNKPEVLRQWKGLLEEKGFIVFTAVSPDEAKAVVQKEYIHLTMIDIRLVDDIDQNDFSGLELAEWMPQEIEKIMLTGFPSVETMNRAYSQAIPGRELPLVFHYAIKKEPPSKTLEAINHCFEIRIKINFSLSVELSPAEGQPVLAGEAAFEFLLEELSLQRADGINRSQFAEELRDLFGKLFSHNHFVSLSLLSEKGYSQTAVVSATADDQAPAVVKFGRRKSIEREYKNYNDHVAPFLTFRSTVCQPPAFTKTLGGIIYTLVGTDLDRVTPFRTYFRNRSAGEIGQVIRNIIRNTCSHWYAARPMGGRQKMPLHELYKTQVGLTQRKMETVLRKEFSEHRGKTLIEFPPIKDSFPNPLKWMKEKEFTFLVNSCRTHGDLNGKNIFVDQNRHSWLIDFYRANVGHVLRDLIALEADIKFSILETSDVSALYEFELALTAPCRFEDLPKFSTRGKRADLAKAFSVIREIRRLAAGLAAPSTDAREYYAGLFYYTVNVIRYPNIYRERKRHALLSAAILAKRLDAWVK